MSFLDTLRRIAPLEGAEAWDNVGLLVDSVAPREEGPVLLTIDLTSEVLEEALAAGVSWIVAYHPPIFSGMKRLVAGDPKARMLLAAIQAGVRVYSPHTALDNREGGINDWLADGLGASSRREAIEQEGGALAGRLVTLEAGVSLAELAGRIQAFLGMSYLRVAVSPEGPAVVRTVALCAGAGHSVIERANADVYFTGEMRHHDVLAANAAGTHVVLAEHTNTERGYLPIFREELAAAHPEVEFLISAVDRDPLTIHA